MRIFIKSHIALFLTVLIQGGFTWLYFWFLGFQSWGHVIYSISIQVLFIVGYLTYRWIEDYKLYKWIQADEEERGLIPSFGSSFFVRTLQERVLEEKALADERILQSEAEVKEKVTFMNQWVHQMKTPLSVIHLMIQDQDEPVFQDIRKELFKLEEGLKTVLYSSRLTLFEKDYYIEAFSLTLFMKEVVKENKRLFFQFGVFPNMIISDDFTVLSDKKWIKFVIEQILSNAVKYSKGKANKVEIQVQKQNDEILLKITDYGIGIPEQDLKRVFEPYFTGENGRKYHESTGMGLYLVKEILHRLSHRFTIQSEVNKGTTFIIYFNTNN